MLCHSNKFPVEVCTIADYYSLNYGLKQSCVLLRPLCTIVCNYDVMIGSECLTFTLAESVIPQVNSLQLLFKSTRQSEVDTEGNVP